MTMEATKPTGQKEVNGICHYCGISCGVKATINEAGGRRELVSLIGDKHNPVYHGYSCAKGRELPTHLSHPKRLLKPLKKQADGSFSSISSDEAVAEIAAKLGDIAQTYGPDAIAAYNGTYSLEPPLANVSSAFMKALGSKMTFGTGSIDQPGKVLAAALHGNWRGGAPAFSEADAWLLVGTNPEVSKLGGIPAANPAYYLHKANQGGLKLVVIDPRRTDAARKAYLHIQPKPGEDPAILAGMIRIILDEALYDKDFVAENTSGIEQLREYVEPFTVDAVARQADIPGEQLLEAARLFANAGKAGANAGTGPNMAPRGTLTEYLLLCLTSICGHWLRAGDRVPNPGVLVARGDAIAQASAPMEAAWGFPPFLRKGNLTNTMVGLPTSALADEILEPGERQIRALLCIGGNPMMAWPDQIKTKQAMEALDLLVVIDPKLTETAQFADYVIAPRLSMEVPHCSMEQEALQLAYFGWGYPAPWGQYAPQLVDTPENSDLLDDWEFLYKLAQKMGLQLKVRSSMFPRMYDPRPVSTELDMQNQPTTDEMLEIVTLGSRIPLQEVKKYPEGHLFEDPECVVLPKDENCEDRLSLANSHMLALLKDALSPAFPGDEQFDFRLISRRMPNFVNSQGRDIERFIRKRRHNPAFMHPQDIASNGLKEGDAIRITSRRASILGIIEAEEGLRRGVISMAHSFGPVPGEGEENPEDGGHTGRLSSNDLDYVEDHSGLPRMSAIPVNIEAV